MSPKRTLTILWYKLIKGCRYLVVDVAEHGGKVLREMRPNNRNMVRVFDDAFAKNVADA